MNQKTRFIATLVVFYLASLFLVWYITSTAGHHIDSCPLQSDYQLILNKRRGYIVVDGSKELGTIRFGHAGQMDSLLLKDNE